KDHHRCLPRIGIPVQPGCYVCIHQPRGILRSCRKLGCIASEMEETFMGGDRSSHRSSWYWTYSSIRFHPSSSKPFLYPVMGNLFDSVLETNPSAFDGFVIPLFESKDQISKGQVGGILSSHSAAFLLREKWKKRILDVSLVAPSAYVAVLGGVGGLAPVLLEEDASA
ncbi:hypothetical protein Tco_0083025, partial [Tanacetum coccineum]